jgi:preprotein translocase subunit SecE
MNKLTQSVTGVKTFVGEVKTELRKSSWPSRQELVESTVVVIVATALVGAFVGASDLILLKLLKLVVGQ